MDLMNEGVKGAYAIALFFLSATLNCSSQAYFYWAAWAPLVNQPLGFGGNV